ncbi:SWIM zinc finger family protein [Streptomyces avermitilis]|uniref:SWIM zinc finger family protein n=1 Tax=Streptomyces avermitilis TaxID=33903 RepID=UPI0037FE55D2
MTALENSTLDWGRLSRGRTYARQGMVGPTTVAPGQVKAPVQGSLPRPYRSSVHLPVLTDTQWNTLLDTIAARAGHLAALLGGEMPAELVDDARRAGVPLLPQSTELAPDCSCPDWGYPCLRSEASFAHMCGVAPIPASSGKTNRNRLVPAGAGRGGGQTDACGPRSRICGRVSAWPSEIWASSWPWS